MVREKVEAAMLNKALQVCSMFSAHLYVLKLRGGLYRCALSVLENIEVMFSRTLRGVHCRCAMCVLKNIEHTYRAHLVA